MYTPMMQGLLGSLLGQGHPLLAPPQNPYGGIATGGPPVDPQGMAAPMNATPINVQAPPVHASFLQHVQAFMQNNPQAMQGLMGMFGGAQGGQEPQFLQAPGLGIAPGGGQPWGGRTY